MTRRIESRGGDVLHDVLAKAHAEMLASGDVVAFTFNDQEIEARPGETFGDTKARVSEQLGFPVRDREQMAADAKAENERIEREWAEAIERAGAATEAELHEEEAPRPKELKALTRYVEELTERPHDYGTCVYAMSLAATAAYQYVAGRLGVTGFQASCADLDIIRRTRGLEGPFAILDAKDLLYPQTDPRAKVEGYLKEWAPWAAEQAREMLAKDDTNAPDLRAHPRVRAHWERLAKETP